MLFLHRTTTQRSLFLHGKWIALGTQRNLLWFSNILFMLMIWITIKVPSVVESLHFRGIRLSWLRRSLSFYSMERETWHNLASKPEELKKHKDSSIQFKRYDIFFLFFISYFGLKILIWEISPRLLESQV